MKKICGVLLCVLMLCGCGSNETTTVCKGNIDEVTEGEVVVVSQDDKVNTMTTTVNYDFSKYVNDSYPISYFENSIKDQSPDYDSLKGVTAKMTTDDNKIVFKIVIDFDKANIKELSDQGVITGGSDVKYISLEETIKNQENSGLTCKEQ